MRSRASVKRLCPPTTSAITPKTPIAGTISFLMLHSKLRANPRFVLVVSLFFLFPSLISAQQSAPNLGGLRWRMIGPFRGGRTIAVSGVEGDPSTYYFGGVGGGVWKSTNGGMTWTPIFDSQPIASIGAIAVAPSDPNTIYVGTGEADFRSNLTYGNGVYKSTDAGKSWTNIGLRDTRHI